MVRAIPLMTGETSGLSLPAHRLHDGFRVWKLTRGQFGIDQLAVDADLEPAAAGRHERQPAEGLFELQEFLRQTDGLRLVVSSRAIFDADVQAHNLATIEGRTAGVKVTAVSIATSVGTSAALLNLASGSSSGRSSARCHVGVAPQHVVACTPTRPT